jgi:hypothetical protein
MERQISDIYMIITTLSSLAVGAIGTAWMTVGSRRRRMQPNAGIADESRSDLRFDFN